MLRCGRHALDLVAPARHGHRQRHARFVLRRRPLPRSPRARSPTRAGCSPTAPTSSTSAASRRGPAPQPVAEARGARARDPARRGAGRARASPVSVDTTQARRDARGDRRRRGDDQRRPRAARRRARSRPSRGSDAAVCLMHMQGEPRTMQQAPRYDDVVAEVRDFLLARARPARRPASRASASCVDPGFGFGKTLAHNLALLRALPALVADRLSGAGGPVAQVDRSGAITGRDVGERLPASVAAALAAVARGAAHRARARRARDGRCAEGLARRSNP